MKIKISEVQLPMKEWTRACMGSSQRGMWDKASLADGHPKAFKSLTFIAILYKRTDAANIAVLQRKGYDSVCDNPMKENATL